MSRKVDSLDDVFPKMNAMLDNIIYELPEKLNVIEKPKIKNFNETIDELILTNKSFCRFGDGELFLIMGKGIGFQDKNDLLAKRLQDVLTSESENIMVGINYHYFYADLSDFYDYPKFVYRSFIHEIRENLKSFLVSDKQYYAVGCTSVYNI